MADGESDLTPIAWESFAKLVKISEILFFSINFFYWGNEKRLKSLPSGLAAAAVLVFLTATAWTWIVATYFFA